MPHAHEWGDVETSRFSGTVHRKCQVYGCNNITLDLDEPEGDETLGSCGCTDYHMADCPTRTGSSDDYDSGEDDWYGSRENEDDFNRRAMG